VPLVLVVLTALLQLALGPRAGTLGARD